MAYPTPWRVASRSPWRVVRVVGAAIETATGDVSQVIGPARLRGIEGCWHRSGSLCHEDAARASKLVGLVKPWALRLSTWSRLLVPSILPLEARSLWCQARISSDQAMMVSTMSWSSFWRPYAGARGRAREMLYRRKPRR